MNFKGRLKEWIRYEGLSPEALSGRIPFSKSQIYNYLNGSSEPSLTFLTALDDEFPHIDLNWLITGAGQMLSNSVHQVATGNGIVMVGGKVSGQVVAGDNNHAVNIRESESSWPINGSVTIKTVLSILEDYVSPKVINEIKERLGGG